MAIDTTGPRSRRALLAGVGGAVAALTAQALGRPFAARAEGQTVVVGGEYVDATSRTYIRNQTNAEWVFQAQTDDGIALVGYADTGTALQGYSNFGLGLDVPTGRVRLNQVSGVATIPAGATSAVVSPGLDVVSTAFVLVTPMANIGTRALWATKSATNDTITIRMSPSRSTPTKVAWLLLENEPPPPKPLA